LFVSQTIATQGRLGKPLMLLLGDVEELAAQRSEGLFTKTAVRSRGAAGACVRP
jgi:hypothetical protein